ncbi:hypothetical protein D3C85_132880 [compost metagenome]
MFTLSYRDVEEIMKNRRSIEQDHRFIMWRILNGLGFKNLESAKRTLSGIDYKKKLVDPGIAKF